MYLSVIIPCYNEEKRIGMTLDAIDRYLSKQSYDWEVIVVDNGSTDGTIAMVETYRSRLRSLTIIEENCYGKGWAVRQGMLAARGKYRLFTDADNSTDIHQVAALLVHATRGYDLVVSSRRVEGARIIHPQPLHRRFLGDTFSWLVRSIVPLGIKDTQNGFKLFSDRAAEHIFAHQTIFYWAFDVEVLALAKKFGYQVMEAPIVWVNDERSKVNIKGMLRMLYEVLTVRINLSTNDYEKRVSEGAADYKPARQHTSYVAPKH
jgi:dolichyl-phosphate beta-glucosyltransferase